MALMHPTKRMNWKIHLPLALIVIFLINLHGIKAVSTDGRSILLICLDGLRHDVFKLAEMKNLEQFAQDGVCAKALIPVFPPSSWPTQQSLVTGLYPESHGIVSNYFWDPDLKMRFSYKARPHFAINFWKKEGVEPIWLTNERQGGMSAVHSWVGLEAYTLPTYVAKTLFEGWGSFYGFISNLRQTIKYFKDNVDEIITRLTSDRPPTFSALYWDHPDWCGHKYGPESWESKYVAERTDKEAFGYLLEKLKEKDLVDKLNVIIVADHGMKRVYNAPVIGLDNYLRRDAFALSDSGTFASLWPRQGMENEIMANLSQALPFLRAYRKKDVPSYLHYNQSSRNAPIFILPATGYFVGYKSGVYSNPGIHTLPPDDPAMHTIFLARGPAFKKGIIVEPFSSVDVYPMMTQILGIKPMPHNGSLNLAKQILQRQYLEKMGGKIQGAMAFLNPNMRRVKQSQVNGEVYFRTMVSINGSNTTEIRFVLQGLEPFKRYRVSVYRYAPFNNLAGCISMGDTFQYFDIPQPGNTLQTTIMADKNGEFLKVFSQDDITLNGPGSIIGRAFVVEDIQKSELPYSCGKISVISPTSVDEASPKVSEQEGKSNTTRNTTVAF